MCILYVYHTWTFSDFVAGFSISSDNERLSEVILKYLYPLVSLGCSVFAFCFSVFLSVHGLILRIIRTQFP